MKNQNRQNPNRFSNNNHSQSPSGQTGGKSNNQSSPNKQVNNPSDMKIQGGNKSGDNSSTNQSVNKSNASSNQSNNKSNFNNSSSNKSTSNMSSSKSGNNSKNNSGQNTSATDKRNNLGSGNKNVKSHNPGGGNNSTSNSNYKGPLLVLGAPTYDLPNKEQPIESEKKFTGRCRLFVANIPSNATEDSLRALFQQYGQVSEVFISSKNSKNSFAFVKMDTRKHAEEARSSLDNKTYEGRTLRVRMAAHAAAVRVKNLSPMVTNELLEYAFSYFGEVERAIVIGDDRGRSIGEGIVEFARKSSAQNCIKRCGVDCFLLTSNPAPVHIESLEQRDEDEGFGEKNINKNSPEFRLERELGPRFADPATFEYEFACRFKQLYEIEKERRTRLEEEIQEARKALLNQLELQRTEHQTKLLKEKLREMEEKVARCDEIRNQTLEQERVREQERAQKEMLLRQREEEILRPGPIQDYAMLRRQENDLRQQALVLQDMLDRVSLCVNLIPIILSINCELIVNHTDF